MHNEKHTHVKRTIADMIFLILGCAIGAFSTTAVMIPNGLTCGGLTGIVRIVQNYISIDFSVLYYALAIVIWIVVILTLGFREGKKVLLVTLLYPAVLFVFEKLDFQLLEEKDLLLAAIFCGIFAGGMQRLRLLERLFVLRNGIHREDCEEKVDASGGYQPHSACAGLRYHRDFGIYLWAQYRAVRLGNADHRIQGC